MITRRHAQTIVVCCVLTALGLPTTGCAQPRTDPAPETGSEWSSTARPVSGPTSKSMGSGGTASPDGSGLKTRSVSISVSPGLTGPRFQGPQVLVQGVANIDPRNDGMMLVVDQFIPSSSFLGCVNADHWAVAVPIARTRPNAAARYVEHNDYPREALFEAILRFVEEDLAR